MAQLGKAGPLMRPVHISIEPTNVCNALCPVCETGKGDMQRVSGFLEYSKFCSFIDDVAPTTAILLFYFMGEPFLNKQSYAMIKYAREKDIYVESCTNGDLVDPEKLIESDINKISFQIGGMCQETHGRYRVNSDLERVKGNLMKLIKLRNQVEKKSLEIEVGFIVMQHNEHEVDHFIQWTKDIGVDAANIIDPCVRNIMEGHAYLPMNRKYWFYDEAAFDRGEIVPKIIPHNSCTWVWNSIQINWDGSAVPCCRDPNGTNILGNVFEQGIDNVFNSDAAHEFRKRILRNQRELEICKLCSGYGLPKIDKNNQHKSHIQIHSIND